MYRNGIRTEGVKDDDIVHGRPVLQRKTRIADDHLALRSARREMAEVARIPGDALDLSVDLVKRPLLARLCVIGERSRAEANGANGFETAGRPGRQELGNRTGHV